jgi:uncharacterized membrane protein (UPF0127 family)
METKEIRNRKKFQKNRLALIAFLAIVFLIIFVVLLIGSNNKTTSGTKLRHTESATELNIEIADEDLEREQGLMGRTNLPEDFAMLFVYPNSEKRIFWMLNTPESLDLIFLDQNLRVINFFKDTQPNQTTTRYSSRRPSMYIIEAKAGLINRLNIKTGDEFSLSK